MEKVGAWLKGGELELLKIVDILLKCRVISKAEQYGSRVGRRQRSDFCSKYLVGLYELVLCPKRLRYLIRLPFLSLSLTGSIPIHLSITSHCSANRGGSSTEKALAIAHKAAAGGVVARRVVPSEVVDRGVGAAVVTTVAGMEFEVEPEGFVASYEAGSLLNTVAFAVAYMS
jgi:hypothetical protein